MTHTITRQEHATPSPEIILAGLKGIKEMSQMIDVSTQTLDNWFHNKPKLFKALLRDCVAIKGEKI